MYLKIIRRSENTCFVVAICTYEVGTLPDSCRFERESNPWPMQHSRRLELLLIFLTRFLNISISYIPFKMENIVLRVESYKTMKS